MENLKVLSSSIMWEQSKIRFGKKITYLNEILVHKEHISISKTMLIDGEIKRSDLTHIPIELIDKIKSLIDK